MSRALDLPCLEEILCVWIGICGNFFVFFFSDPYFGSARIPKSNRPSMKSFDLTLWGSSSNGTLSPKIRDYYLPFIGLHYCAADLGTETLWWVLLYKLQQHLRFQSTDDFISVCLSRWAKIRSPDPQFPPLQARFINSDQCMFSVGFQLRKAGSQKSRLGFQIWSF